MISSDTRLGVQSLYLDQRSHKWFSTQYAAKVCSMYIPQVSALIPRPDLNRMDRMCQRHGSIQNSHPSVLVRESLCKQFIHYHIGRRGVFCVYQFKLRYFAVVAIECFFVTVDRYSIMASIHRLSVMIYGSLLG